MHARCMHANTGAACAAAVQGLCRPLHACPLCVAAGKTFRHCPACSCCSRLVKHVEERQQDGGEEQEQEQERDPAKAAACPEDPAAMQRAQGMAKALLLQQVRVCALEESTAAAGALHE